MFHTCSPVWKILGNLRRQTRRNRKHATLIVWVVNLSEKSKKRRGVGLFARHGVREGTSIKGAWTGGDRGYLKEETEK